VVGADVAVRWRRILGDGRSPGRRAAGAYRRRPARSRPRRARLWPGQ